MGAIIGRARSLLGTDERASTILVSVFIFALIVACGASAVAYRGSVPEHVDGDTINFTESDYEQALAKWEASGVVEYTTMLTRDEDRITLRVNRETQDIFLLEWLRGGKAYEAASPDPNNPVIRGLYRNLTPDGMFETARQWLDLMAGGGRTAPSIEDTDYFNDFVVRFDPNLGYPAYLANFTRAAHRSREVIWRTHSQPILEVIELTVIR